MDFIVPIFDRFMLLLAIFMWPLRRYDLALFHFAFRATLTNGYLGFSESLLPCR
jgi:hypothetical protein